MTTFPPCPAAPCLYSPRHKAGDAVRVWMGSNSAIDGVVQERKKRLARDQLGCYLVRIPNGSYGAFLALCHETELEAL